MNRVKIRLLAIRTFWMAVSVAAPLANICEARAEVGRKKPPQHNGTLQPDFENKTFIVSQIMEACYYVIDSNSSELKTSCDKQASFIKRFHVWKGKVFVDVIGAGYVGSASNPFAENSIRPGEGAVFTIGQRTELIGDPKYKDYLHDNSTEGTLTSMIVAAEINNKDLMLTMYNVGEARYNRMNRTFLANQHTKLVEMITFDLEAGKCIYKSQQNEVFAAIKPETIGKNEGNFPTFMYIRQVNTTKKSECKVQ